MGELILLIGSGGREHALAWKLSQSNLIDKIFVAPGNAGTSTVAKVSNVDLNVKDFESISNWCRSNNITFVIVGPEDPLAAGIVDFLTGTGIPTFGPTASAAKIESDKSFAKHFMVRHGIPTARFKSFTEPDEACKYIVNADFAALVVKASGLAAGKGVVVASSQEGACEAVREMMTDKKYGAAGDVVVVEELLEGPEVSVLAFTDGINVHIMPPAQDHKRLLEKDEGPNTGGMGAICPYPGLTPSDLDFIQKEVLEKTVSGMVKEGNKYTGVLYAGLMITKDGPKVLEFNCRFGDPETQSILSLMTSDLLPTLKACVSGNLKQALPSFDTSRTAVGVVVVSGGYPDGYRKGLKISGIDEVERNGVRVFHAGTSQDAEGQVVTSGGRVLAVVATESTAILASQRATAEAAKVQFEGAYYRKDIGHKSFKRSSRESTPTVTDDQGGLRYKDAGVDIIAGDYLVNAIKPLAKMTRRSGCDADLGGFGGIFDLSAPGLNKSVLTCRTWGVGPKLKLAESLGHHYNIGFDLLAQCVNELITLGAEPIFVLDYYATGKLNVPCAEEVVRGIAEGCLEAGCALIGGETAELPGMYRNQDYDVAGIAVGAIPEFHLKSERQQPAAGDKVLALTSSGLQHEDFVILEELLSLYSMNAHKIKGVNGGATLGEEILVPSHIYVKPVLPLVHAGKVKSFVYVSDGLSKCVTRVLPPGTSARLDAHKWPLGPVFGWMAEMTKLSAEDMAQYSSCGIAAVLVVGQKDVQSVKVALSSLQIDVKEIGQIEETTGDTRDVIVDGLQSVLEKAKSVARQHAPENFAKHLECVPDVQGKLHKPDFSAVLDIAKRPGAVLNKDGGPPTFDISSLNLEHPVLVSGTDGVGTKLKIAQALNDHGDIGADLVAMCVNDILASGADPLFFTCYLGTGRQDPDLVEIVLKSVAEGCQKAGCALIEQHISYLPSIYSGNIYDLGGFSVGVVEKSKMMTSTDEIQTGDAVIGLSSSGLHSNGFSLVRKVVELHNLRFDMPCPFDKSVTLGRKLLTQTEIYVKSVLPALHSGKVKGFAHITGGGLTENIPRVLPSGAGVRLDASSWEVQPVFGWLQYMTEQMDMGQRTVSFARQSRSSWFISSSVVPSYDAFYMPPDRGKINDHEMARTFNCGLGAVLIVSKSHVTEVLAVLSENQAKARVVGSVVSVPGADSEKVVIDNLGTSLSTSWPRPKLPERKKKVGVLISGSGTNLQALIDHTQNKSHNSAAEITLVVSNKADVAGLTRAQRAGIKTLVIKHEEYKSRKDFDAAVHEQLVLHGIDIVCLAGFMRILTGEFVDKWTGRMLNIHPSLLPSFKGAHAQKLAIEAGVRISGCSIHFVSEEVDGGALIAQESVPVYPGDTEATLAERIKTVEHIAYPKALELLASERIQLGTDGKIVWSW